jgi:hypothetical protein
MKNISKCILKQKKRLRRKFNKLSERDKKRRGLDEKK